MPAKYDDRIRSLLYEQYVQGIPATEATVNVNSQLGENIVKTRTAQGWFKRFRSEQQSEGEQVLLNQPPTRKRKNDLSKIIVQKYDDDSVVVNVAENFVGKNEAANNDDLNDEFNNNFGQDINQEREFSEEKLLTTTNNERGEEFNGLDFEGHSLNIDNTIVDPMAEAGDEAYAIGGNSPSAAVFSESMTAAYQSLGAIQDSLNMIENEWQKRSVALAQSSVADADERARRRIASLEAQLRKKNRQISALVAENAQLKAMAGKYRKLRETLNESLID